MKWIEKFRRVFMAASFAEVGEWDTAKEMVKQGEAKRPSKRASKRTGRRARPRARVYKA